MDIHILKPKERLGFQTAFRQPGFLFTNPDRTSFSLILFLLVIAFGCGNEEGKEFDMVEGGHTGPSPQAGPPMDAASWHIVPGNVLDVDQMWGVRANVRATFQISGSLGIMYTAHPGAEVLQDPVWRIEQERKGLVRAGGGSFAFSNNLVNWEYMDRPMLTIDDYASWVPERIVATDEELKKGGRVHHNWVVYKDGKYYFSINGSTRTGEGRTYSSTLVVSDSPVGPFEHLAHISENQQPPGANKPVFHNNKWYSIYADVWDGKHGFGLAWSDNLTGPYYENPDNPIITVKNINRAHPTLFNYNDVWGVLFSEGDQRYSMPLRLAVAHFHPSMLPFAGTGGSPTNP